MKNKINIISLFDGLSSGQISLNHFIKENEYAYYSSEINESSIKVTNYHYPNTIQIGDVKNVNLNTLPNDIFLLIGGSPCQDLSIAGRKIGMVTETNIEITSLESYLKLKEENFSFKGDSYLFWEYVRFLKEKKPKYFLFENVLMKGKSKKWELIISKILGVEPIKINSSLLTAQNRERLYWTNIPNIIPPEDKKIMVWDIIPNSIGGRGIRGTKNKITKKYEYKSTIRKDGKSNCLVCYDRTNLISFENGLCRPLTIKERELLQGIPIDYTKVPNVSNHQRKIMIGNGWTINVINHILSFTPEFN